MIGFDNNNVYIAHIQPGPGVVGAGTRSDLANNMARAGTFEGVDLDRRHILVIGAADFQAATPAGVLIHQTRTIRCNTHGGRATLVGFASNSGVYYVLQSDNTAPGTPAAGNRVVFNMLDILNAANRPPPGMSNQATE
jgi:hypothetical protein